MVRTNNNNNNNKNAVSPHQHGKIDSQNKNKALMKTSAENNTKLIDTRLSEQASMLALNENGETDLTAACQRTRIEAAEKLLDEIQKKLAEPRSWEREKEACKNLLDELNNALVYSVENNNKTLLTVIKEKPSDYFSLLPHDYSFSAVKDFTNCFMYHKKHNKPAQQEVGKHSQTHRLWLASPCNLYDWGEDMTRNAIEILLEKGLHVDLDMLDYEEVLHDIDYGNNADLVKILIKQSSAERKIKALRKVIKRDRGYWDPTSYQGRLNSKFIAALFEDNDSTENLFKRLDEDLQYDFFWHVCCRGSNQLLELLMKNHPNLDVNKIEPDIFRTGLEYALMRANIAITDTNKSEIHEIVNTLIKNGCNVDKFAGSHTTTINKAIELKRMDLVRLLIQEGNADVNTAYTRIGPLPPPLLLAIKQKNKEAVELLLNSKTMSNAVRRIICTIEDGVTPIAELLINGHGSNIYYKNEVLPYAFIRAISRANVEALETLLDIDKGLRGCTFINDIDMHDGYTPLMRAIKHWKCEFTSSSSSFADKDREIRGYKNGLAIIEKLLTHEEIDLNIKAGTGKRRDQVHFTALNFLLSKRDFIFNQRNTFWLEDVFKLIENFFSGGAELTFTSDEEIIKFAQFVFYTHKKNKPSSSWEQYKETVHELISKGMRLGTASQYNKRKSCNQHLSLGIFSLEGKTYLQTVKKEIASKLNMPGEKLKKVFESDETLGKLLTQQSSSVSLLNTEQTNHRLLNTVLFQFVETIKRLILTQGLYKAIIDSALLPSSLQIVIKTFASSKLLTPEMRYKLCCHKYRFNLPKEFDVFDFMVLDSIGIPRIRSRADFIKPILTSLLTYKDMYNLTKLRKQLNEENNNSDDKIMFLMNLKEGNNNGIALKQTTQEAPKTLLTT